MKKRVLQFIGSFNQGGSEQQAVELTRLLCDAKSFDVFAATLNGQGVLRPDIDKLDLPPVAEFPLTSFYNADFLLKVRACAKFLVENKIDLVHTHDFYTNVFGMAAASLAGISPRIASKRETGGMRSKAEEFIEKIAFLRAKAVVVNANAVRDHLVERSIPGAKIRVVYNGVDMSRFAPREVNTSSFRLPPKARLVTVVANLRHRVKNLPMLLNAAKTTVAAVDDVDFAIAGEGELESSLMACVAELGISERVHFLGRCDDVPGLLAISYACVLTSTAEGFSNSILEYMAAGKPVVATDVGGAAEAVVHGETGYLVSSGDSTAMGSRIVELLNDEDLASRFGTAGRQRVGANFSVDTRLRKTVELYNTVIEKNARA